MEVDGGTLAGPCNATADDGAIVADGGTDAAWAVLIWIADGAGAFFAIPDAETEPAAGDV